MLGLPWWHHPPLHPVHNRIGSMFSIGEFSKITGLTVKTLRFYHEEGLLVPTRVDPGSGYRYYAEDKIEAAHLISLLRGLEFPIADIREILGKRDDEEDILTYLTAQQQRSEAKQRHYQELSESLREIISNEREAQSKMRATNFAVEEKQLQPMLVASVRMCGKYSECGQGFAKIGKRLGRHICGKPFLLHHDAEYREEEANFEACLPIRKGAGDEQISVRELPGGNCVALMHRGPYEELGRAYAKLLGHLKSQHYEIVMPTREVYIKGPGMLLKGNPQKYLTEIQMLVRSIDR